MADDLPDTRKLGGHVQGEHLSDVQVQGRLPWIHTVDLEVVAVHVEGVGVVSVGHDVPDDRVVSAHLEGVTVSENVSVQGVENWGLLGGKLGVRVVGQ